MSAPNLLRVGTEENIFVEIQDHSGGSLDVQILVKNHPSKLKVLTSTNVQLTADNKFQALASIIIPEAEFTNEDHSQKQYVYLQAVFPDRVLEKVVLLSFQSGYIFIQTDKTIYTPRSDVNPNMKPVVRGSKGKRDTAISIEIMTPDNITISREIVTPEAGIKSGVFKLQEVVSQGFWRVICRFQSTPQQTFSATFEVKEYVLPSFEITLTPRKTFFYVDDEELTVDIRAKYLFGKEVEGTAYVVFGVATDDGNKRNFPGSLNRVGISEGKGVATLTKKHITDTFSDIHKLVKSYIYIKVNVLTQGGSEMGEAEKKGIQIVTSPYTIHFKRTPKFFKPGMSFDVTVLITNPDESPAAGVRVLMNPGDVPAVTMANGFAKATVNSKEGINKLKIMVQTNAPDIAAFRQASASMEAASYNTKTKNILHISVVSTELQKDENINVNLFFGNSQAQQHDITYLILSRGQLVVAGRYKRSGNQIVALSLPVTKEMMPSFRIVAYYHVGPNEVVSDSAWLDVKMTCMGLLKIESTKARPFYQPRNLFSIRLTGDPEAKVGLVAVDKGVYVLNNKHRLTQRKVWDIVEKYDTGCTPGGGKDSMGVFYDAGLIFETNTASGTDLRQEPRCPVTARKRQAATILDVRTNLVGNFTTKLEKDCCMDGMKDSQLSYSCDRRAEYIQDGPACVNAFKHCCNELSDKRQTMRHEALELARSELNDDEDYMSSNSIQLHSWFPESWLWKDITLPSCPANNPNCTTICEEIKNSLPDSITTWEVTAISLSSTNGICVSDPFEMIAVKEFLIDLWLPYSAVRGEQLEIKAVLHNYSPEEATVRVELIEAADVCSSASKRGRFRQEVFVPATSTRVVPFIIIPMATGDFPIEVKAAVKNSFQVSDGIRKILRVVPEGVLIKKLFSVALNPANHSNNIQEEVINSGIPKGDQVPNTESTTRISVTAGQQMSGLVEKAISGNSMGSLIVQPAGCGEQNMIRMTLPVIATFYLDKTNQWEDVGLNKRNTAVQHIKTGYQNQLGFRKVDGSYSVYVHTKSSTWLTAYVAKVFAMASDHLIEDDNVLCDAVKWLIVSSLQPDGSFNEPAPIYSGAMIGDGPGSDLITSMTAFVLIAMQEARPLCEATVNSMAGSMDKAVAYLEQRLDSLTNPYAVAMTSYALANAGKFNREILYRFVSPELNHWRVRKGVMYTREATAYALLALVKVKAFQDAAPIVKWLNKQRDVGGGYGSTQATIIVYQAIAEYWINVKNLKEINLNVDLEVAGRAGGPVKFNFNKGNSFLTRTVDPVVTLYYAYPKEKESDCSNFQLSVGLTPVHVDSDENENSYQLKIEILYKNKDRDATMSILDIGLLTGFVPDISDLDQLSKGRDRYIEKYEMNTVLSERGSLILYMNKVSHTRPDEIAFRIHQKIKVGVLQPAAVSVYEYYEQTHCVKFYHPEREDGKLRRLCAGADN
ncbi:complement C3-like, partial [Aplochiton taeniatus]